FTHLHIGCTFEWSDQTKFRDMDKIKTNEQLILEAANKVFKEKGYDGTTVQDIADAADTTKSMVNYYFRSKEKLFGIVFKAQFQEFYGGTIDFIKSDLSLYEKIVKIVEHDTENILKFPLLPIFILNEINRNPEIVFSLISNPSSDALDTLDKQISKEVRNGKIKRISAIDLLTNVRSLTVFPFLLKGIQMKSLKLTEEQMNLRLKARKKMIVELIWSSLKK
ncbi:MAG TPA: helix-turn-helix domain-containing protein, partial [Cyclobacteriaceae bacterium]